MSEEQEQKADLQERIEALQAQIGAQQNDDQQPVK